MPLSRNARRLVGTALLSSILLSSTTAAQETLVSPEPELRALLLQRLQGTVPDFEQLALQTDAVRTADEFDKSSALMRENERLQDVWRNLEQTKVIEFNIRTFLGDYNDDDAGFPLRLFEPGTFIQGAVPIMFSNATEMQIFPVVRDDGRDVLSKAGASRDVTLTIRLVDLKASVLRSNTIEARVAEVIVRDRTGSEIGSYISEQPTNAATTEEILSAQDVAISISNTLDIPVAGQTWNEVLPFLEAQAAVLGTGGNFSGQLFSFMNGEFRTQRPLDQYRDLTLVYGNSEQSAQLSFRQATRRSFGFDGSPRPFGNLDCFTPKVADTCGILRFEKIGEHDILVDIMSVSEQPDAANTSVTATAPFDVNTLAAMSSAETQVAFTPFELGGEGNGAVGALMYWAGDLAQAALPLNDLRAGFSDTFAAKTMLWIIDGQNERSIYVTRSSLP